MSPAFSLLNIGLAKGVFKAFVGKLKFEVDKEKQLITITAGGKETIYSFEQLIDEIERIFKE